MPASEKKIEYVKKYSKDHYKRIPLDVDYATFYDIKAAATRAGKPVNTYIKEAISDRMEKERSSP